MKISGMPRKGWVCPSCVTLLTNGDGVEGNEAKRQKVEKEIDLKKFKNVIVKNMINIMAACMTALPKTRNSLASSNNSQEPLKFRVLRTLKNLKNLKMSGIPIFVRKNLKNLKMSGK